MSLELNRRNKPQKELTKEVQENHWKEVQEESTKEPIEEVKDEIFRISIGQSFRETMMRKTLMLRKKT